MHTHIEESVQERKEFFIQLNKLIKTNMPDKAALLEEFLKYYFRLVALDDLKSRNLEDLYGSILSYWNFITQKDEDKTYVRVYNPQYESMVGTHHIRL